MASTSGSPSTSETNGLLVEQFCSVTGASRDKAYKMLEVCNWNLEMAINMHVDTDFPDNQNNKNIIDEKDDPAVNVVDVDDSIRPPIPQSRAILVEEDLNFRFGLRTRKRRSHSVFDGFRDFQAEARIHQELSTESNEAVKKRRTLEDLFRPPLDLMHRGTFESARDYGQLSNRWLMVNIQNSQEFACQVLNRDVWSNPEVKRLINKHFVFWQVYSDSLDGERYMQFYDPVEFPYVAVIDPRTGEKLVVWNNVEVGSIRNLVDEFIKKNCTPNGTNADELNSTNQPTVVKCATIMPTSPDKYSLLDQSEEAQLRAALAASLKENNMSRTSVDDNNESEVETFESDSENTFDNNNKFSKNNSSNNNASSEHSCDTIDVVGFSESNGKGDEEGATVGESWKDFLGAEDDPKTDIVLRLPDGKREQITWPCSTKIKSLLLYIGELGYHSEDYELVTNFPRRNLGDLDLLKTLKEVDLFPREMIIVQQKS